MRMICRNVSFYSHTEYRTENIIGINVRLSAELYFGYYKDQNFL